MIPIYYIKQTVREIRIQFSQAVGFRRPHALLKYREVKKKKKGKQKTHELLQKPISELACLVLLICLMYCQTRKEPKPHGEKSKKSEF